MATTRNRRQVMLLGLLFVLIAVAVWSNRGWLVPGLGSAEIGAARVALGDSLARLEQLPEIVIERPALDTTYDRERNLFEFGLSPARLRAMELQEEQQRKAADDRARREQLLAEQRKNQPPPPPRRPPEPKAPEFRYDYVAYLGELRDPEGYVAVLQVPGMARREIRKDDVVVVGRGETVDDVFVVRAVGIDELEIGYTDPRFKDRTKRVRLIEAKPETGRR
jgi:hypothetical protein